MTDRPKCSFCSAVPEDGQEWFTGGPKSVAGVSICERCIQTCKTTLRDRDGMLARRKRYAQGIAALLAALHEGVIGQPVASRAVGAALLEHHGAIARRDDGADDFELRRSPRVLLVGPPGTGKTTLCRALRDASPWPVAFTHANKHAVHSVPAGAIDDLVGSLFVRANEDLDEAERGVVIVDGFDLRAPPGPPNGNLDRRAAIERELLRLLDGVAFKYAYQPATVRSDGLLVVVAATVARADLPERPDAGERELRACVRKSGASEAFLARFDRVVLLPPLGIGEMRQLLVRPRGAIERAARAVQSSGSGFEITPGAIDALASAAAGDPDGAWAVARPLSRLLEEVVASTPRLWAVDDAAARRWIESP